MISKVILIVLFCLGLIPLSCLVGRPSGPLIKEPEPKTVESPVPQEDWERDWQKTVVVAKREGILTIYTAVGGEVRQVLGQAFKERFGVDVEWAPGKSAELPAKLLKERQAGLYLADLFLGGTGPFILILKPAGVLEPMRPLLVLPEIVDEKAWSGGRLPFADKEQTYIVAPLLGPGGHVTINSNMVKPEEISSWNNLLEPRWKEKIVVMDPSGGTAGISNLFMALDMIMGPDFWRKFVANTPMVIRDGNLATLWIASGRYPIGVALSTDPVREAMKAGAPLKNVLPREGGPTSAQSSMAFIKQAPHPNAARVFMNWFLSKEGNYLSSKLNDLPGLRRDVPTDHLPPEMILDPSAKYVVPSTEELTLQKPAYDARALEIFGPLLK